MGEFKKMLGLIFYIKKNKKGFTLVELIIVITILAILATIGFVLFGSNIGKANNAKLATNLQSVNKLIESKLSTGEDINDFISGSLLNENGVNTNSTIGSGAYILGNLNYKVGNLNFYKLKINGKDLKIETENGNKNYIFSTLKTSGKIYYQIAGEVKNESGNNEAIIYGKYYSTAETDAKGLISEKGYDIGLVNNQVLTGSLY